MIFNKLSKKQALLIDWWSRKEVIENEINSIVMSGAVRTGKTLFGSYGYFLYCQKVANDMIEDNRRGEKGWNEFGIIGRTMSSITRNITGELSKFAQRLGYKTTIKSGYFLSLTVYIFKCLLCNILLV